MAPLQIDVTADQVLYFPHWLNANIYSNGDTVKMFYTGYLKSRNETRT